ncbi:acetate kinase [Salinicoccus halodurans]|uniref:Acetate kinase n=1 Tax=Salinicoccus halodurans TaxID=407035 RepID=A0A0F7HMC8_9STAP|nr:acetate kinase [Salinicoccus halodurans]AKG74254.1 acetate kinase [Salinicoccus halodurans]SFK93599.1 acetate kinase [Salinicoccus halodurans]
MSKIIAINAGSSSFKFQLFEMPEEKEIAKGLVERIGLDNGIFSITVDGEKKTINQDFRNHEEAVNLMLEKLVENGVISSINDIDASGHRVVHGGEVFDESVLIDDEVVKEIQKLSELAPLHNPANLMGINAFREQLPDVPHVAVFDTSFHQTMPESSYLYSLPYNYYKDYGIRKYGFHGTSHKYVTQRAAELMNRPLEELRIISCHLGNGASIAAVRGGESIDTSMGFTPLAGVTMGTRSGNIDPALIPYIMEKTGKSAVEVLNVLNKESGLLGVSGFSSDLRDIEEEAQKGNERAELALEVFGERIHKYMGSYATRMGGLDAIIFTAGVGENSDIVRAKVLEGLEFMGVYFDVTSNDVRGQEKFINHPYSPVKIIIIPTNEEVMIARDVMSIAGL